jgi:hypothetical protein
MKLPARQTNFYYLLTALLFMLVSVPLADDLGVMNSPLARSVIFSTLLFIGVWSLRGGGRFFVAGIALAVTGIFLNLLAINVHSEWLQYVSLLALTGFLLVAIAFTLNQVTFGTELNVNRLIGAICVYLLLGVIWALLYTLVDAVVPGSFAGFEPTEGVGWNSEWLYFSFVTMTTLGYGDILPVSATARVLAYLQAVAGLFYIAVLVAGLVGAYIADRQKEVSG